MFKYIIDVIRKVAVLYDGSQQSSILGQGNIRLLNIFSVEGKNILSELDEYEAISLVFLVLDQDQLARRAFIFCQKISHGRYKVG